MDRFRHKTRKDKHVKHVDKDKLNSTVTDIKTIRENLKIKEILQTVKMNSHMRIKAPRGSKVMQTKDFADDIFDENSSQVLEAETMETPVLKEHTSDEDVNVSDSVVPLKTEADNDNETNYDTQESLGKQTSVAIHSETEEAENNQTASESTPANPVNTLIANSIPVMITPPDQENDKKQETVETPNTEVIFRRDLTRNDSTLLRDRKLSLDHTLLSRREGLSQSEIDLHSMGKSPLERKSSFFRKKMDNFLKNTTEIFRRHSSHFKVQPGVQRRGSMSVSLQSLYEDKCSAEIDGTLERQDSVTQGSMTSLKSASSVSSTDSQQSINQSSIGDVKLRKMTSSQPTLCDSQPVIEQADQLKRMSDIYSQESVLRSRAISMSSGLDTAYSRHPTRPKGGWVGREGLNSLQLQRLIEDENNITKQCSRSYQDFSSMMETTAYAAKLDTKGRRLSYQRAVSGENLPPNKNQVTSRRKREKSVNSDILEHLTNFSLYGIPNIRGYTKVKLSRNAENCLQFAQAQEEFEILFDWKIRCSIGPEPPVVVPEFQKKEFFYKPFQQPLTKNEKDRQAVIRELITTEADYIRHLRAIVEVFVSTAHALQDVGLLLHVDTEKLFVNIPDVLNASLTFWEETLFPMIEDAIENNAPFNTELMASGFCRFREVFQPYERYVGAQSKALDYLRSLSNNAEFVTYLCWCHKQKSCRRLQLGDIMVKPMQRLTKYGLIIRRIIGSTEIEPERTSLIAMESFASNYVLDLNRAIRQREELEVLDNLSNDIESYEIDFKDDDLDRAFRLFSQINLRSPMINSLPNHSRSLIHRGDLRFKDHIKEMEAHVILLTDMILVCKKQNKGVFGFKLVRPKYMVDKVIVYPKYGKNCRDMNSLVFVCIDEVGSSVAAFSFTEIKEKEPNPQNSLKTWEQKVKEAKLTYELGVWYAMHPSRDISDVDMDTSSDYAASGSSKGKNSDDYNIERDARERVAAMLHRSMGASTEYDCSVGSMGTTDSFDAGEGTSHSGGRHVYNLRHPMYRTSTGGSSRNSRLSSFHQSSAASHDDPQPGPRHRDYYRAGTSVEHLIPPMNPDDAVTSITVNVVSESESDTIMPPMPPPPSLQSVTAATRNTLRVQPASGVMALVHSLPDLSFESPTPHQHYQHPQHHLPQHHGYNHGYSHGQHCAHGHGHGHGHIHSHSSVTQSASDKLYQTHHENLQRNRLRAQQQMQQQHYLSPDHRGTSYPPPSPTRASLKRGLAFSYSLKNPPLSKMGHVNSQSAQPSVHCDPSQRNEVSATNPLLVPPSTSDRQNNKQQPKKDKSVSSSSFFSSGGWHSKLDG